MSDQVLDQPFTPAIRFWLGTARKGDPFGQWFAEVLLIPQFGAGTIRGSMDRTVLRNFAAYVDHQHGAHVTAVAMETLAHFHNWVDPKLPVPHPRATPGPVAKMLGPALPYAGVTVGEVIGWRIWLVTKDGRLKSYARENIWAPDLPMRGTPDKTGEGMTGVWAFKTAAHARVKMRQTLADRSTVALGQVALWGEVIEHEVGWRGEYARVASLQLAARRLTATTKKARLKAYRGQRRRLFALRRRYGVGAPVESK